MSSYPKVLIIGQFFHKKSGSGITMTNLFMGWDKDRIAVAASELVNPDYSVCQNYYNLGESEIERGFPFNLMNRKQFSISGAVTENTEQKKLTALPVQVSAIGKLKDQLLLFSGQIHRRRKFVCSTNFRKWLDDLAPDIIYSQLASLELIRFVKDIYQLLKIPMVFHLMDDWPTTITLPQRSFFRTYWTATIDKELRYILSKASILLSISDYMSDEYYKRYGFYFTAFHNPIDLKQWIIPGKNYEYESSFKILYAGRIGTGLQDSLIDVAVAVDELNKEDSNIEFHIQATNDNPVLKELERFNFVKVRKPTAYTELPTVFAKADLLLLPNDFDGKSISFLKFSMPTKASEYMASGTPILVYSNIETAVTRHALQYRWAVVVSENKKELLKDAITKLYINKKLRMEMGANARELAIQKFESSIIRANFKSVFQSIFIEKQ